MARKERDLHYVDPSVRKTIVSKIVFYWCACLVFSTLPLIIGTSLAKSDRLFVHHIGDLAERYWPLYLIMMGILPFAIRDALRIANRTLGSASRVKSALAGFKKTGEFQAISCRDGDILADLIGEINDALGNFKKANADMSARTGS